MSGRKALSMSQRAASGLGGMDWWLVSLALLASFIGFFAIWTTDYATAIDFRWFLPAETFNQLKSLLIAVVLFVGVVIVLHKRRPQTWTFITYTVVISAVILNALVLTTTFGREINGARRWLDLGVIPTIQPSEFAKVAVILLLAYALAGRSEPPAARKGGLGFLTLQLLWSAWTRGKFLIPIFALCGLILYQSDMKTTALILVCTVIIMLAAGCRFRRILLLGFASVVALVFMLFAEPYRLERIQAKYGFGQQTEAQIQADRYQAEQALTGFATGGWTGQGIGEGRVKENMPVGTSDYVLVTVGEELGLVGSTVVILSVLAVSFRCFVLAVRSRNRRVGLYFFGLSLWIGLQTMANTLMVTDVFATMGVPIPFISAGGSSITALWVAIGLGMAMRSEARSVAKEGRTEATRYRWRDGRTRLSGA